MIKPYWFIFCLLAVNFGAGAQAVYDAGSIPKELLPYASSVVRNEEINVEVKDLDNTLFHIKEAITVLNKNGDNSAQIVIEHDRITNIKYIRGTVYNEFGQLIQKFSESDFEDVSAGDGFSLFQDIRIKHYQPAVNNYPYTIVYEYETRSKQSLDLSGWMPNPRIGVAVEKSSFTFACKPDFNIRYKETNLPGKVSTGTSPAGLKTYSWQVNDLKAIGSEPFSPYAGNLLSSVRIAPQKFSYYGYTGAFNNWKDLGLWQYSKLVADRQELPAATVDHIKEITRDIPDPRLKAKKIYEYMQGKTHYISVQVGIGGIQPFLASDVDQQNYGDCKALVNYTQALLKVVGIESYYCIVESGRGYKVSMLNDFASLGQGDHIILCLPFKNDTTWAECTSETIPFGYLGGFTDDRTVLACTPEGGKLMHTPKYSAVDNLESRKASFTINENGELSGDMTSTFKGVEYEERSYLASDDNKEQIKQLKEIYPVDNMAIENVQIRLAKSEHPVVTENIKFRSRDYASVANGRLSFILNSFDRAAAPPPQVQNRVNDVYINRGFTKEDEVTYTLPAGYRLEKSPINYSVKQPFGSFSVSITVKGDQVIYRRKLQMIDGTYRKDLYDTLVDFYQTVHDADEYIVSLVK